MKRVLLMSLFCCLGFIALSQPTTIRIYATGAAGSYQTGSATSSSRFDGDIVSTSSISAGGPERGYAVFDLTAVPATATVTSVVTQFHVASYTGTGAPSGWQTFGYAGDLSTVTSAPVLYADMVVGTTLSTATYGTGTGNQTLATTPAAVTFVQSNIGNKVSWSWTGGNNRVYTITGETGTVSTAAGHAPYIEVTYTCTGTSGVTATAAPNPVCPGNTFTVTGTGTGISTYTWAGPSSYAATGSVQTIAASASTTGVYTLTARNTAGCAVITTTSSVTLAVAPTITPAAATNICVGSTTALAGSPASGTWASSAVGVATVSPSGVVGGITQGTANITYTNASAPFCWATKPVTVNALPAPIAPATPRVCMGSTITMSNTSTAGTWSVGPVAIATIIPATGVLTGVSAGTATVTYNNGCGSPATIVVTVDPPPAVITGPTSVCELGGTITLSDATAGGSWTGSANASATTISATQGLITGISDGTATITYTSALSCVRTYTLTVNPAPEAITGTLKHCYGTTTTLSETIAGGTWSSSTPPVATLLSPGVFFGASGGYATISYTNACGTATALDTVVATPPPFIGGDTVCLGGTLVLADSVIGGTWSSSNPLKATVLSGSGVVTGVDTGLVTITYTLPPGCAVTGYVRVILGPPAITGTTDVCPGKTTALFNASAGGTWSSGSPAVATVGLTSGVVTGITPNTAIITYTDTHGCTATTLVIVNPIPPPIIGDSVLCASATVTLYNSAIGGTWSSITPGIATVGGTTGIVTAVNGGTAIIRYIFTGTGCYIGKTLTVNPAPVPIVTYNYFDNTFEATTGYVSYQWYNSVDGLIASATHSTTAAQVDGSYYVKVVDSNGCVGVSASIPYNSGMLQVNSVGANGFRIYPNPSKGMVYIDAAVKVNVIISDAAGRKELEVKAAKQVNIGSLAPGLHLITVQDEKGTRLGQQKLIKE